MAKMEMQIEITKFCLILFPVATYTKCGGVRVLAIFGFRVFEQVGDAKCLFGVALK
jgi:hypothetical protein